MNRKLKFQMLAALSSGAFIGSRAAQFQVENLVTTVAALGLLVGIFGAVMYSKPKADIK